ncbi:MAG: SIR2 family protein [Verrucomicrobiae bacterium]|nr:SIR2 family protein [Verrucomicrobiae bacterium]
MKGDVLVLGAGASTPYGFPTGNELRNKILEDFSYETKVNGAIFPKILTVVQDPLNLPFSPEQCARFRDEFRLAQTYSIDAFIERRAEEFQEIGKFAISHCLRRCESEAALFDTGDWYQAFWNRVLPNGYPFLREFTVITFNYDRSLQHYLMTAAKAALGPAYRDDMYDRVRILPMHGSFSKVSANAPFGSDEERHTPEFARSIYLPHEFSGKNLQFSPFDNARDALSDAKRIFILGFGFDDTNTERLFNDLDLSKAEIHATGVGLGDGVKRRACDALKRPRQDLFYKGGNATMVELISDLV